MSECGNEKATCSLSEYLNGEFFYRLPQPVKERVAITHNVTFFNKPNRKTRGSYSTSDRVFLLSIEEARVFFGNDADRKATSKSGEKAWWWLRSPGEHEYLVAAGIDTEGAICEGGYNIYETDGGVRPAIWMNMKPSFTLPDELFNGNRKSFHVGELLFEREDWSLASIIPAEIADDSKRSMIITLRKENGRQELVVGPQSEFCVKDLYNHHVPDAIISHLFGEQRPIWQGFDALMKPFSSALYADSYGFVIPDQHIRRIQEVIELYANQNHLNYLYVELLSDSFQEQVAEPEGLVKDKVIATFDINTSEQEIISVKLSVSAKDIETDVELFDSKGESIFIGSRYF